MHNRNAELYELGTLFRSFFWKMQTILRDDNKIPCRTIAQVFRVIWGQLLYMYCKVQMSLPFTSGAFPALWLKVGWKNFLWLSDMMIAGIHEPQMHLSSCLPHPLRGISSICMASLFSGLRGLPWRRRTTDFFSIPGASTSLQCRVSIWHAENNPYATLTLSGRTRKELTSNLGLWNFSEIS